MTEERKFTLALSGGVLLVLLVVANALFQDTLLTPLTDYLARRSHYEKAISPKGLSLHQGLYWKEKD